MAHTQVWDSAYENIPADNDQASEGALRIRNLKRDTRERAEVDHDWDDTTDAGKHTQITFVDPLGADPADVADEGMLYTKDVSTKAELFWKDEDGNVLQLSAAGAVFGVQPLDAELTAIAALVSAADKLAYFTGSGTAALTAFTVAGRALVDDADAAAQRTTLGLGALAVLATVDTAEIAAAAVERAKITTATASTAGASNTNTKVDVTLNAYSFFPMLHTGVRQALISGHSVDGASADNPRLAISNIGGGGNTTFDVDHRYINA